MKKRFAVLGGIVVAVGIIGGIFYYLHTNSDGTDDAPVYVTTVSTLMGDVSGTQNRYAGVVEPQKTVSVKVESGRQVKDLKVKEGDRVKKGDVLFEYDESANQDKLAQAQLELDQLINEATSYQNQLATLQKDKEQASADEQLSYTIEIRTTEMNLKKNEYNQKTKQAEIEKLEKNSGDLEVKSELDGVIKKINESAAGGSSDDSDDSDSMMTEGSGSNKTAYITIVATGTYRIKGKVNETNLNSVTEGQPVIIHSRVDADQIWTGTLDGVDTSESEEKNNEDSGFYDSGSEGDEMTTSNSYPFYVALDSSEGLILGQHVYVELDYGQSEKKDGIWLDEFYIVDAEENPYVWASTSKDRLEKRSVTLGEYDEELGKYEITEGLSKTDCIAFPDDTCKEGVKTTINEGGQILDDTGIDSGFDSSFDSGSDSSFDSDSDSSFDSDSDSSFDSDSDSGSGSDLSGRISPEGEVRV